MEKLLCTTHDNFSLLFTKKQQKQINFLKNFFSKYTNRIYIVGGFIRDQLLHKQSVDIDIEVYDIPYDKFKLLMKELKADDKGAKFFVYKWEDIDISLPRIETKIGSGYFGFDVSISNDEQEASKRRDFTINALMYNIYTNELLDFYSGTNDIKNKTIKAVNYKSFKEDSLRVLRAIRFSLNLGFKIDRKTYKLMQDMSIKDLREKQISNELRKVQLDLFEILPI